MILQGTIGPSLSADGVPPPNGIRLNRLGDAAISQLHGRFYEQTFRGNVYSIGMTLTALTVGTVTLTATTAPILGLYNPSSSTVNLVPLQAALTCVVNTSTTPVSAGAFVWASSFGNPNVSTGNTPFNHKTLASTGSQAKGFNMSPILTGLTNNLVIFEGADISSPSALTLGTLGLTTVTIGAFGVQNFDGNLIVPPGGVLALLNTTATSTMSVAGRLKWEEVPAT